MCRNLRHILIFASVNINIIYLPRMEDKTISDISQRSSIDAARVAKFLAVFADIVREECGNENNIAIPGFGTFAGLKHDESVVRNLASGRNMLLPPSIELQFKPGGMLRKKIKEVQK